MEQQVTWAMNGVLFAIGIALLVRNLHESIEVYRLELKVKRKFHRFAMLFAEARALNEELIDKAHGNSEIIIKQGEPEPDYLVSLANFRSRSRRARGV